jgi:hypothetical protein
MLNYNFLPDLHGCGGKTDDLLPPAGKITDI